MSEKVLRAVKIERPETHCVEYMMQVSASFAEDELFPVPEKYIANILANNLREYVMYAVTDESIATILKSGIPTVCPRCRRKMVDDGKMAHGTLTAEQVREAIERHSAWTIGNNRCFHDGAYEEIAAELGSEINGDTSDGYHTFNELYHHRAVLFSVIVRDHGELAWKARKHHDGTMYDGMFIVGIETPKGQATYHYDLDPYWEMFDCEEREFAPEWDGHTPDEAIARIAELGKVVA